MNVLAKFGLGGLASRLTRFGLVGASGTVLNLTLFWVLTTLLGTNSLVAATLSFEVAMCSNFVLNHNWTFRDRRVADAPALAGLARYQAVSIAGLVVNLLVLRALSDGVGVVPLLANATGIAVAMAWNFVLSLVWTWRAAEAPAYAAVNHARG